MEDKAFVLWVADNIYHNHVTLTGKGTFHGISVILTSTFQMIKDIPVPRLTERRKANDFVKKREFQLYRTQEKARWIITVDNAAYRTAYINILLTYKGTVYSPVALQLVFWSIQLQLVGFHAEYYTRMQYLEKIPNFLFAYY